MTVSCWNKIVRIIAFSLTSHKCNQSVFNFYIDKGHHVCFNPHWFS